MKKLSEGYIFYKLLNNNNTVYDTLKKPIRNIDVVEMTSIEDEIKNISKRFNTSLKERILSQYISGNIILAHNTEYLGNVPITIPAWTTMYKDKVVAVSNLTKICTGNNIKPNIQERELFAALHYGYVVQEFATNRGKYINSAEFRKLGATVYSELLLKIFDKLYSLKASKVNLVATRYVLAKFFYINHLGLENNKTTDDACYAIASKGLPTAFNMILEVTADISDKTYDNIYELFESLKNIGGLGRLDFKLVLQEYLLLYGEPMLLGLENLPLFTANIVTALISSRYVRSNIIETVIGQQTLTGFYAAFSR